MNKTDRYLYDLMKVELQPGVIDGLELDTFVADMKSLEGVYHIASGRPLVHGETYTRLVDRKHLNHRGKPTVWMSDSPAERKDHMPFLKVASYMSAKSAIINGLGIGMVISALIKMPHIERIEVVEFDWRVIELVANQYIRKANDRGKTLVVHQSDAYAMLKAWAPDARWDVGWSDIWPTIGDSKYLPEMNKLNAYYDEHTLWHGCWGYDEAMEDAL